MVDLLPFPIKAHQQRARLAASEARDWQLRRFAEAADCASAASSILSNSVIRLLDGQTIGDVEPALNGETLDDLLNAVLFTIEAINNDEYRELVRVIKAHFSQRPDGGNDAA